MAAAIAFVGRPNVGKSSLLNALLGEDRAIVSEVPGTTRDAIDTTLAWGRSEVVLIDTAGIRRRGKVASGPAAERFSTLRALKAIGRADVAVLVIDAVEGLTAQDAHVAGYIVDEGKGLVVAVNKWELVEGKTGQTFDQYVEWIQNEVPFLDFAPVVSIARRRASAWAGCSRWPSTSGANGASGSRPASSTASSGPRSSARSRRSSRTAGRRSSTERRRRSRRRRSSSSRTTPARSTSATDAISRTGCAMNSDSRGRRSD